VGQYVDWEGFSYATAVVSNSTYEYIANAVRDPSVVEAHRPRLSPTPGGRRMERDNAELSSLFSPPPINALSGVRQSVSR